MVIKSILFLLAIQVFSSSLPKEQDLFKDAIAHIQKYEGFVSEVYYDVDGSATIGYGHHLKAGEKFVKINKETAIEILKKDLTIRLNNVKVKYGLPYHKSLALSLFSFNLGEGNLNKAVKNGLLTTPNNFLKYCHYKTHDQGKTIVHKSKKLYERRQYELNLFILKTF